jgi:hypothetical protein
MVRTGLPATWPGWLVKRVLPPPPPPPEERPKPVAQNAGRYAFAALIKAAEHVADAAEGSRDATLNNEAYSLGRFVPSELTAAEITHTLLLAARHAGLPEREALATLNSALRARRVA